MLGPIPAITDANVRYALRLISGLEIRVHELEQRVLPAADPTHGPMTRDEANSAIVGVIESYNLAVVHNFSNLADDILDAIWPL